MLRARLTSAESVSQLMISPGEIAQGKLCVCVRDRASGHASDTDGRQFLSQKSSFQKEPHPPRAAEGGTFSITNGEPSEEIYLGWNILISLIPQCVTTPAG